MLYSNVRKCWHKDDLYVKDIEIVKIYSREPIDVANPTAKLEKNPINKRNVGLWRYKCL